MATYYDIWEVFERYGSRKFYETDTKKRAVKWCRGKYGNDWKQHCRLKCRQSDWSIEDEMLLIDNPDNLLIPQLAKIVHRCDTIVTDKRQELIRAGIHCPTRRLSKREKEMILTLYPLMTAQEVANALMDTFGTKRNVDSVRIFVSTLRVDKGQSIPCKQPLRSKQQKQCREVNQKTS